MSRHADVRPDDVEPCLTCPWQDVCREGFACWRFVAWQKDGVDDPERPRVPTRWRYASLFPENFMEKREPLMRPTENSPVGSSADYGASVVLLGDLVSQNFDPAPADWAEMGMPG